MRNPRDHIEIVGPEGVPLSFPTATVMERGFAFMVDMLVIALITAVMIIMGVTLAGFGGLSEPLAILMVGLFVLAYGYFTFFEIHWQGATPGKRLMNLKVISRDGTGLSAEAVIARNLMREVELFVPFIALTHPEQVFGRAPWWLLVPTAAWVLTMLLLPFLARERTRVGDIVGRTLVVRVPRAKLLADEAARVSLVPSAPDDALRFSADQLAHYGETELETLADLMRRHELREATLQDLGVVAAAIARKIRFEGPLPQHDPARFLRAFYKQQRAALEKGLLFGKRKASKHAD